MAFTEQEAVSYFLTRPDLPEVLGALAEDKKVVSLLKPLQQLFSSSSEGLDASHLDKILEVFTTSHPAQLKHAATVLVEEMGKHNPELRPHLAAMQQPGYKQPDQDANVSFSEEVLQAIVQEIDRLGPAHFVMTWRRPQLLRQPQRLSTVTSAEIEPDDVDPAVTDNKPASPRQDTMPSFEEEELTLLTAAMDGRLRQVEMLLSDGADVDEADQNGHSASHFASAFGHEHVLLKLLESGASVHGTDDEGNTPLHFAAGHGHAGVAKLLLKNGADPALRNSNNATALDLARTNNRAEVVSLLERSSLGL